MVESGSFSTIIFIFFCIQKCKSIRDCPLKLFKPIRCYGIGDLLDNENNIEVASIMYSVSKNDIKVQALLTKKRMEKEKQAKVKTLKLKK